MIAHIHGTVSYCNPDWIVIDVSGIGYKVFSTPGVFEKVSLGTEVFLHTTMIVREDFIALYGFFSPEELEMFHLLISVSRIGPTLAVKIIGAIPPEKLAIALISKDEKELVRIPGIGSKSAQRLMLELGDTLQKRYQTMQIKKPSSSFEDAVLALVALGFSENSARNAVYQENQDTSNVTTASLVKDALAILRSHNELST